jgi:type IV secretion system protein VirD4
MLPQELREMPWTNEIIIQAGIKPILCDKALYFQDTIFIDRLKALSPTLKVIRGLPSESELKRVALTQQELSIELPQIDVHLHKARIEGRQRPLKADESIDVSKLALEIGALPALGDQEQPSAEDLASLVDAIFEQVEPELAILDDLPRRAADGARDVPLAAGQGVIDLEALIETGAVQARA